MAQETSGRACDRCRERRVKCDKRQPTCLRCEKLGKPCPGYDKKRKFVDEGITLRRRFEANWNPTQAAGASAPPSTKRANQRDTPLKQPVDSYQSGSLFDKTIFETTSRQILQQGPTSVDHVVGPDNATFDQTGDVGTDTFQALLPPPIDSNLVDVNALPGLQPQIPFIEPDPAFDESWTDAAFDPQWFDLDIDTYYADGNNSCGFLPNAPNIVGELDRDHPLMRADISGTSLSTGVGTFSVTDSNTYAPESQLNTSALITDEREHEMAFLIRHFSESLGPWWVNIHLQVPTQAADSFRLDLFDKDRHFTQTVPLKALGDALLRNAVAAVAAKQLGRVKGQRAFCGQQEQRPSTLEVVDDAMEIDWFYKAANYYDKAIAFSRQYLQAVSGGVHDAGASTTQLSPPRSSSDDLLVAVSIFSLYESLDNLDVGWLQHLVGLKTLIKELTAKHPSSATHITPALTVGNLASFWNLARADYQAAYINQQKTFLDTDDIELWHSCGLQIQIDGSIYPSVDRIRNEPNHSVATAELVAHTLLFLLLRVMNYLANEVNVPPALRQAQWAQLEQQLDSWYSNLPTTYQPCAQIRHPQALRGPADSTGGGGGGGGRLTEVFFSIDLCAAALQLYHFARILLLLHRPLSSDVPRRGSRLKAYREVSTEAIKHAHEIIGIALGRPRPAIRVEMLLPLYMAGSCLEADGERRLVLDLLRAVEKDTGCSTEGRCSELVREWGWAEEPQGVA